MYTHAHTHVLPLDMRLNLVNCSLAERLRVRGVAPFDQVEHEVIFLVVEEPACCVYACCVYACHICILYNTRRLAA